MLRIRGGTNSSIDAPLSGAESFYEVSHIEGGVTNKIESY